LTQALHASRVETFARSLKTNPGKINVGAPTGTPPHIYGELFKVMAGIDMVPVPYRAGAPP
jgi:tripartite-type tricarboxylate transporter receptor subunit TctC